MYALVHLRTMDTIGKRILHAREQRGLSQIDLAAAAGSSRPYISKLENSVKEKRPRLPLLRKLAVALGVSVEWLRHGEPQALPLKPSRPFDVSQLGEVIDFAEGLVEVELEAEIACGPPMDFAVKGERVLVRRDGPPPDPSIGEFLVRARGDSMTEWEIYDGDYVVIQRKKGAAVFAYGEIVVAWHDGGLTIKVYDKVEGKRMLLAANEHSKSYEVNESTELQGVVRRVLPRARKYFPRISG